MSTKWCMLKALAQTTTHDNQTGTNIIERCPIKVLQAIFDWSTAEALEQTDDRLAISFTISQVSRLWRNTAMATPEIWRGITLDLNRPRDQLDLLWDTVSNRVGELPLTVVIIPGKSSLNTSFPIRFKDVKALKELQFFFNIREDAKAVNLLRLYELLELKFPLPSCRIQRLAIFCPTELPTSLMRELELNSWLTYWPPVSEIDILAFTFVKFSNFFPNSRVTRLFIFPFDVNRMNLLDMARAFPNLTYLWVPRETIIGNYYNLEFRSLRSLTVNPSNNAIWKAIWCPVLEELTVPVDVPFDIFINFLSQHTFIKELQIRQNNSALIHSVTMTVPRLSTLKIEFGRAVEFLYNWSEFGFKQPPFPLLMHLTITDLSAQVSME